MNEEIKPVIEDLVSEIKEEGVELLDIENTQTVVNEYGETPVHEEEIKPVIEEVTEEKSIEE